MVNADSSSSPFVNFRADGWPLCPNCGEDELWSYLAWVEGPPPVEVFVAAGMRCYVCDWELAPAKEAKAAV